MSRNWLQVNRWLILVCLSGAAALGAHGQTPKPKEAAKPPGKIEAPSPAPIADPVGREFRSRGINEKALAVDANVNIKLPCISQARLSINGWERNEIRIFIKNGTKVAFRVHEKDPVSGKPLWVSIANLAADSSRSPMSECLSGESIEVDVPNRSTINITGRETETRIDSVRKVDIKNLGGKVALRNIPDGINAVTFEGDLTVENSSGQISLETSTGNVIAFEVGPGKIGDMFRAKTTNGTITLQKVDHRQIEANSVSGSVGFSGRFLGGGLYNFKTSNGSIRLSLPPDSSCRFWASYGFGTFNSALPLKIVTETVSDGGKSLVASLGGGDATVKVTTSSGSINIGKLQ